MKQKLLKSVNMWLQNKLFNYYNIKNVFEKDFENKFSYGSTPTLKDLPTALSSIPTYVLANSQPPPTRRVWKNIPRWGVETIILILANSNLWLNLFFRAQFNLLLHFMLFPSGSWSRYIMSADFNFSVCMIHLESLLTRNIMVIFSSSSLRDFT